MERLTFERVPVLVLAIAACCLSHKSQQSIGVADCTSSSADGFFSEINLAERIQQERNAVTEFSPSPPPSSLPTAEISTARPDVAQSRYQHERNRA